MNQGIITSLSAISLAQTLKVFTHKRKTGKWEWKSLFQSGGMPSSHAAGVSSLSTHVATKKGFGSIDTALAAIFGAIVMYDAQGIRRHTGEIAKLVNDIDQEIEDISGDVPGFGHVKRKEELTELLGHQPLEVAGGALLGIGVSFINAKINNK